MNDHPSTEAGRREAPIEVAILLFDGLTALDCLGPYEVLQNVPMIECKFVAEKPGLIRTEGGPLVIEAQHSLEAVRNPGVVLVPGGAGNRQLLKNQTVLDWLREAHRTSRWTTSVCTGSLVLGAAGLLDGLRATGHWMFLEPLHSFGAEPTSQRVVIEAEPRIITAAGVSAGIDMALRLLEILFAREVAEAAQLAIEYDPQPHIDAGSPAKAPAAAVELLRSDFAGYPTEAS